MSGSPARRAILTFAALSIFGTASIAWSQVYKCTDTAGKTTYSDAACDAAAKPLKLPEDPKTNVTNPHMCAQMLDETRRLDTEKERDARRGRPETEEHAQQRQKMNKRYSERCVGIARTGSLQR